MIISTCLVLAACSNEGLIDSPNTNDGSIRFGNVATRAEVSDASQINSFKVFAEMNLGEDGTDEANQWVPLFSEGELVSRVGSSNDWTYENKRYWVDNRYFYFYGFYPSSLEVTRTEDADGWVYSSTISVPYAADTDFMTAYKMVPKAAGFEPTVQMSFEHRLARVKFKISKDNGTNIFRVTEIGFSGISRRGTLEFRKGESGDLTPIAESRNVLRRDLNVNIEESGTTLFGNNDGLLLIPQKFVAGQVQLNLSYEYGQSDSSEVEHLTLSKDIPTGEWEAGKTYVYNLKLAADKTIYISTPTVEDWGIPQSGGVIIIK